MVQIVLAEDDDGTLCRELSVQQGLRNAARRCQRLGIADALPITGAAVGQSLPLGDEGLLRRGLRPVHQPVGHARCVLCQLPVGAHVESAVACLPDLDAAHAELQLTVAGPAPLYCLTEGLHGCVCLLHCLCLHSVIF